MHDARIKILLEKAHRGVRETNDSASKAILVPLHLARVRLCSP